MKCMGKIDVTKCKADCCGFVPIEKNVIKKHKDKLHKKAVKLMDVLTAEIWTVGQICGFLDENYKCKIYEDRPEVCRLMGAETFNHPLLKCSHLIELEIPKKEQQLVDTINKFII